MDSHVALGRSPLCSSICIASTLESRGTPLTQQCASTMSFLDDSCCFCPCSVTTRYSDPNR